MCGTAVLEKKSSQKVLFLSMYIIFTLGKSRESLQNCAVRRTGGPTVQRGVKRGIWGYLCGYIFSVDSAVKSGHTGVVIFIFA